MVRPMPIIHAGESFSPIPVAIGLFASVSLLVALCAKHARQVRRKPPSKTSDPNTAVKAMVPSVHAAKKSSGQESDGGNNESHQENGLWQKAILMGERCQPPEFSGVIYYDYSGNRVPEMPKSPRANSTSPLRSFTFPVQKTENSAC